MYGVIPALVGVYFDTGELVTICLETDLLAVEFSTARAKLVELTNIGLHVHKQR